VLCSLVGAWAGIRFYFGSEKPARGPASLGASPWQSSFETAKDQCGLPGRSSKLSFERRLVEAVGIEPTSEELRSPVSPCAAGALNLTPMTIVRRPSVGPARKISADAFGRRGGPARQIASDLRPTGGVMR